MQPRTADGRLHWVTTFARTRETKDAVEPVDPSRRDDALTVRTGAARVDVGALYEQHWRSMVRLAVLLVDDVAAAEDVVQDAFIALHRNLAGLRDPDAAVAYIRVAVVNRARSVLRRRMVARKHLTVAEPEAGPSAADLAQVNDEHREVLAAVRTLPRRQREVLVLRYWMGLSEREIADELGIALGTVKSQASRGMDKIETLLGGRS